MTDGEPHFALRELQARFASPAVLIGMASLAVVLGLSGPFGTFARLNLAERLVYWLAIVALTYLVGLVCARLAQQGLRHHIRRPALLELVAAGLAGTPVTLVVLAINLIAFAGDPGVPPLFLWVSCSLIAVLAAVIRQQLPGAAPLQPAPGQPAAAVGPSPMVAAVPRDVPAIVERLPADKRGALLALSVEDHYVQVITSRGRGLVLIRLGDAIRETQPVAGLQIHRSHWVALEAVTGVQRSEGRVLLVLASGDVLPVSRSMLPQVRAAGLLDRS